MKPASLVAYPRTAGLPGVAALLTTVLLLGAASPSAHAASTGTASLYMPQGVGAITSQGDYITSGTAPGLNTSYHYFIEVPSGLGRLRVQLFDADIGAGGNAEAAAQRDRQRNGFNTTAIYTLIRPDGTTAATLTCTAAVSAACADNAWVSLLDSSTAQNTAAGHWELRVDQSTTAATGDDAINALGIRADDGDATSGGTEISIYYDSHNQFGVNPPATGSNTRSYNVYPYITSGCSASENDFDYDSNQGNTGSIALSSRTAAFTHNLASTSLSANNVWIRNNVTGWTTDSDAIDYGVWKAVTSITSYIDANNVENGNYSNVYYTNFNAAANPPTANPTANSFRVYLPTDAGTAPVEPYLEQQLRYSGSGGNNGPNPPVVGSDTVFTVTVRMVNPTAQAITFSATNLVTANVPGPAANDKYDGIAQVSQGTVTAQPAVGGTGNITWNPGTLAAGGTAVLAFRVIVHPTSAGQRIPVVATPASGNGTRATYVDHTGNTTQARATYTFGPLCELAATQGLITEALISSLTAHAENGGVTVEWKTASESASLGFYVYRLDFSSGRWMQLNQNLLPALFASPQGGTYRFFDASASAREPQRYALVEVESGGRQRIHGPWSVTVDWSPTGGHDTQTFAATGFDRVALPPTRPPHKGGPAASLAGGASAIRIGVRQTGLYALRSADLAPLFGMSQAVVESWIGKGKLALSRQGQPVAWYAEGGKSKQSSVLYFYGEANHNLYSEDNVYRLERGGGGVSMTAAQVVAAADSAGGAFTGTGHAEQDVFPATAIPLDPESDYWFWDFLLAGDPTYGTKSFTLAAPGLAAVPATAVLTVHLQGASASGVAQEHHAAVSLNGTALGESHWQGIAGQDASFTFDAALLHESGNQVQVTGLLDAGVPFSVFYVNSFDVSYPRLFRAASDALAFRGEGSAMLTVTGLSGPAVRLVEISDPLHPRWVTGAAVTPAAGSYDLSFRPAAPQTPYLAVGPSGLLTPSSLRQWSNAGLKSPGNAVDYVVVTNADLAAAAQRLADYRASQGLRTLVVDLQAIMDEFNFGQPNPHAIHDFLAYARSGWATAPRYVVLAGAGSLDYRNKLGFGDSLVPPLMVSNDGGLFPSDNRLADLTGNDALPEMAIGRIPALTAADLNAYVDKILAYEGDAATDWPRNALALSDATDQGANFAAAGDRISGLLPGAYAVARIDLSTTALADARSQLLHDLDSGASLVNYVGHGGLDRLSSGGLLTNADVAPMANGSRLPVLTALTCEVNRFAVPGVPSLGETLVNHAGGGAAAVWGPSGLSVNAEAGLLGERLFRLIAEPGAAPLGDLVLQALQDYQSRGGTTSMIEIYNLLGDPALRLKRAAPSAVAPSGGTRE
ncbi:MAG TPA: C25 family cysteine peptidase [Thermoanaerobaculia bacterium]|nr:C25 family cysteine peptidase [Thermoanaerobaculia bacterium]